MRLIGMLDSPYVRRVAVSLEVLGVAFGHEAVLSECRSLWAGEQIQLQHEFRVVDPFVRPPAV